LASDWALTNKKVAVLTTYSDEKVNCDFFQISSKVKRIRLSQVCKERNVKGTFQRFLLFRKIVLSEKPDTLISFMSHINVLTLIALLGTRIPIVVIENSDPFLEPLGKIISWLRPFVYRHAKAVCIHTVDAARKIEHKWKLSKVHTIPIPLLKDIPTPNSWENRENVVLSVGRLSREKGHDVLISAWALLGKKTSNWKLKIVGDGPDREKYEKQISELGLKDTVKLVGKFFPIWPSYQEAKIFVMPSRFEGYGMALLEAMLMGCACIASESEGPKSIVTNGVNGILVEVENPEALASGLECLLHDDEKSLKLSEHGMLLRKENEENDYLQKWNKIIS